MFKHFKKSVIAGVLCGAALLSVMPSLGLAETVRNFDSPEGRLFEEYKYVPVTRRVRAKMLFDNGRHLNTDLYRIIKNFWGFQAAEDYRYAWILYDLAYHTGVMRACILRNTLN